MSDWATASLITAFAALVLLLPGGALLAVAGIRGTANIGLAGPVSIALIGGSAVLAGLVSIPFSIAVPAVVTVLFAVTLFAVQRSQMIEKIPEAFRGSSWRSTGPLLAALILSATVVGYLAFRDVGTPDLVTQTYDGVFHLNAVARILEVGDGSSFTLYRVAHPGTDIEFYPAGWHDVVAIVAQVTGASVATSTSCVWIAVNGLVLPAGTAFLVSTLDIGASWRRVVVPSAALLSTAGAFSPYVLLQWGVLFPTGLAYALLPAGLGLMVLGFRRDLSRRQRIVVLGLLVVWFIGSAFAHPRSLPTAAVMAAPFLLIAFGRHLKARWAEPAARRRTAILAISALLVTAATAVAALAAAFAYFDAATRPISDRLNGAPATAHQTVWESLTQIVLLAPPVGSGESTIAPALALAAVTLVGLVWCLVSPRLRWVAVAYLLLVLLYCLASASNSDLAKVATAVWYKDKYRILSAVGVLVPVLATAGLVAFGRLIDRARSHRGAAASTALLALVLPLSWFGPSSAEMSRAIGANYVVPERKSGSLIDESDAQLLLELPSLVPEGSRVIGNPWNGSVLTWVLGEREPLFPHFTGGWDADRLLVASSLDTVATDPAVCEALDRLDAHYLFASDGLLWNGDQQATLFPGIDRAPDAAGLTEVTSIGDSTLYRITACD